MLMAGIAGFGMLYSTQPLLPQIGAEFDVSAAAAALTVSAGTGGLAITVVLATWVGQRIGRVAVMKAGLAIAVAAQLISTFMPTFGLLIAARIVLGLALAGVIGVAMGHVGVETHRSGLGQAMGLYVAGNSIGGVLGRLTTSSLAEVTTWRVADAVLGCMVVVTTVAFVVLLPSSQQAVRSRRSESDRIDRRAWREPRIWLLAAVPFLLMGGFVALYNFLSYRLADPPFGLSPGLIGLAFLAYLAGTGSSLIAGNAVDRFGRPGTMAASLLLMVFGIVLTLPDRLPLVIVGLVVLTAGFFASHAVASGWMPLIAGPLGPLASGVYVSAYYAGSSVLGAATGLVWTVGGWPATVATVLVFTALAAGCIAVVASRRLSS